jgi:hypothetical protein
MNMPGWGQEDLSEMPTRDRLDDMLRCKLNHNEEAAILIERIHTMWETLDVLVARFGAELARQIIDAPQTILEKRGV